MNSSAKISPDVSLKSSPATVLWGYLAANVPPALTIKSSQTVRIEALSHQGLTTDKDPESFFGAFGVSPDDVLPDAKTIYSQAKRGKEAGVHILTGPIYIEGAEPGDMLEVRVREIEFRVPYGINASRPGRGVLPEHLEKPATKFIPLDLEQRVALFSKEIEIPLNPFMGIMAVAPPASMGMVSSTPPGVWGGNMDLKQLIVGSTLYLPVWNDGAQFFTGDGHAVQGDGEVDGGALEISLAPTLQFLLHKKKDLRVPMAETPTHFIAMGMSVDLNEATKFAVQEAVNFLQREKKLGPAEAYALASLAVDLHVGEAVDIVNLVYALIPKSLFKDHPSYWFKP